MACRAYVNGKGAGRVAEGVTLSGPHHFAWNGAWQGGRGRPDGALPAHEPRRGSAV